jgi:hypothetical protein
MAFIGSATVDRARVESVVMRDNGPVVASAKRATAGMLLHSQRENLYLSLEVLNDKLSRIHAADVDVLSDVLLQSQLFGTSIRAYDVSVNLDEHALDEALWAKPLAEEILGFCEKLQDLHKISPLYLWPFLKLEELIGELDEIGEGELVMPALLAGVAGSLLETHRWRIEALRTVAPQKPLLGRLALGHYNELACAAEFLASIDQGRQSHWSVEADSKFCTEDAMKCLTEGRDLVFVFFEENERFAEGIDLLIQRFPVGQWGEQSRLFIFTESTFAFPPRIVRRFRIFALE